MHPRLEPVRRVIGAYSPARLALKGAADRAVEAAADAAGRTRAIDALAASLPPLDVLVVGVYLRTPKRFPDSVAELARSRHRVRIRLGTMASQPLPELAPVTTDAGLTGGKFANANALIEGDGGPPPRWIVVIDHDARLPEGWLDRFLGLAEAFDLSIAQPALNLRSFYSHPLTRRRPWAVARETRFVEIGPVTALRADAAAHLLPFAPDAGMGWGLDLHWPALAVRHGLRMGIVDAAAVGHEDEPFGASYSAVAASAEADAWLASRESLSRADAIRTLATHRRVPRPTS
ncbi:MAG: hypothetical protein QOE28_3054 [Solirubrobacteraceae bacterium]|nr:hypothetical protein [Solirubrobacteraceae bacterium]